MRLARFRLTLVALLACLVFLAALLSPAAPVTAEVTQGGSFGSAVPCLLAPDAFATTCFADTIFHRAPANDPALVQVGLSTKAPLATVGAKAPPANAPVSGIGSVYGLAYDDGSVSGVRRIFAAAYLKRLSSFGSGGPGGVYAYNLNTGVWQLAFTVPDAGWTRTRATDTYDADAVPHVGRSGLGDMEISPDGRELFIVNIAARRIERYDISSSAPQRNGAIGIDGALSALGLTDTGARTDAVPFALEFYPVPDAAGNAALVLGLTDTAARFVRADGTLFPLGYPRVHLATYLLGNGQWVGSLTQDLRATPLHERLAGGAVAALWSNDPYRSRGLSGWNPWHNVLFHMPRATTPGLNDYLFYPQPLLADIEFTRDGRRMFLGLRDRTGDQSFVAEAPPNHFASIAQGDTLAYTLSGGAWLLEVPARQRDPVNVNPADPRWLRPAPSDVFDDNRHNLTLAQEPVHVENHLGALATALQGGAAGLSERIASTSLLGSYQSGLVFYGEGGGTWSSAPNVLLTASSYAGGKTSALGDLEVLCTYAFVSGRLWHDLDNDGEQEPGEPGIGGVRLEAFRGAPSQPADATATTAADGSYRFALPPNTPYRIRINATDRAPGGRVHGLTFARGNVAGVPDSRDSDASQIFGFVELAGSKAAPSAGETREALRTPMREEEFAVDIGLSSLAPQGIIGDTVWIDLNRDGLQGADEAKLPGHLLESMRFTLVPDPATAHAIGATPSTVEYMNGSYRFRHVPPGRYAVAFGNLPAGYTVAPYKVHGDAGDAIDSDATPPTLRTHWVTMPSMPPNSPPPEILTLDLGLVPNLIDLAITLSATPSVLPGGRIAYELAVSNFNSARLPALDVVVAQQLPAGVAIDSVDGSPNIDGQTLTWRLGTIEAGNTIRLRAEAIAPATAAASGQVILHSSAVASTRSLEVTLNNNSAEAATQLVRPALRIVKSAPAAAQVGNEVTFSLAYSNSGSAAANNVTVSDRLPPELVFRAFVVNPGGACRYDGGDRTVRCGLGSLAPGTAGTVAFTALVPPTSEMAAAINTATISTTTAGDDPSDNASTTTTVIQRPDPGVAVSITPSPFPVATRGTVEVRYGNGLRSWATAAAQNTSLIVELASASFDRVSVPRDCAFLNGGTQLSCALGTLNPGASGGLSLPVTLATDYAANQLAVTATISSTSPETPGALADNTSRAAVDVVRPNVFVDATGPTTIVGRGSVFYYTLEYGNIHRPAPALTRGAADVVLEATLPSEVELVQAHPSPSRVAGRTLTWNLGTLAARSTGRAHVVVRTAVNAGASLALDAAISTTTPGDNLADNTDSVVTDVVLPPADIPDLASDLRLALRSELDPNSQDRRPDNGVYLTDGTHFSWPAGEILDLTPRIRRLIIPDEANLPYPYAYRARVIGWSLSSITVNGKTYDPADADSRGRARCRAGAATADLPRLLQGCAYGYVEGTNLEAIRRAAPLREEQLHDQAHLYWTQPPAPAQDENIYLYVVEPLAPVRFEVQVEVEIRIVNAAPGEIDGVPLPEVPVVPLPEPERQLLTETFEVTLVVPRSVVGPGNP